MAKTTKPVTRLCYTDIDEIRVRGKDLCNELIGRLTFTEMMMLHLTGKTPTEQQVKIVDAVLVTIMEHGLTPSAIAARQTWFGAPEALQGAVAAGILGVGSRFAGTSGDCAKLLQEIVDAGERGGQETALAIVKRFREAKRPVPGYGHPDHKNGDPRVARLVEIANGLGVEGKYIEAMNLLGETINKVTGRNLVINASAAIGAVLAEVGIPIGIMRGLVIVSRAAGVVGHIQEEMEQPASPYVWDLIRDGVPYRED